MIDSTLVRVFCANLRRIRKDKGVTQAELADRLGVSQPAYNRIETGDGAATLTTIEKLATALGVRASELLETEKPASVTA